MNSGIRLLLVCATVTISAGSSLYASTDVPPLNEAAFAYRINHPFTMLPEAVLGRLADHDNETDLAVLDGESPLPLGLRAPRLQSRSGVCGAVQSVARANGLPVPFFANLIWQESRFDSKIVSRAGAQGIAQFMPKTAVMYGLVNPFEPLHALNVAGRFLRELHEQFGNLGLAAAAYNAGPRRVADWIAKRGALPNETRHYVLAITGRPAEEWLQPAITSMPEAALMPAKAPCAEVAEAVAEQERVVRVSRLMADLVKAATPAREAETDAANARIEEPAGGDSATGGKTRIAHANDTDKSSAASTGRGRDPASRSAMEGTIAKAAGSGRRATSSASQSAVKPAAKATAESNGDVRMRSASKADGRSSKAGKTRTAANGAGAPKQEPDAKSTAATTAKPADKGATKVAAKQEPSSKETAGSGKPAPQDGAEDAGKEPPKQAARPSADEAPPRRRTGVRRTRLATYDRHSIVP